MDNNLRNTEVSDLDFVSVTGQNKLLRASFSWMSLAMLLTSLSALLFAFVPELKSVLYVETELGLKPTILAYVVMFSPPVFILAINFGLNRMSFSALIGVFVSFAIVMGISLSSIFLRYDVA